ncbi:hypothetical protein O1611_g5668 [Lasiodiplodia mahajangana]|uniref:Uncharacterized protein n=1 Tax=Lasiodiplodia mahajangana TaxID=1108764 RepID=A0ACC2JKD3_9PEZI|nr:hypothetical protein O1611_g5668 [Lasiodiplodia mahajangana]
MIASIVKTINLQAITQTTDPTYNMATLAIWWTLEAYLVLLAVSIPTLRSIAAKESDKAVSRRFNATNRLNSQGRGRLASSESNERPFERLYNSTFHTDITSRNRLIQYGTAITDGISSEGEPEFELTNQSGIRKNTTVSCPQSCMFGMRKDPVPKNWPPSIPYLSQPSLAPHLTEAQRGSLRTRSPDLAAVIPSNFPRGPCPLVKIIPINDLSHPANGQAGLFAARRLEPGDLILPYYGLVHSSLPPYSLTHDKSDYDLWLNRESGVAVDADQVGNEARFINDYRGVRERPNAEFRQCWDMRSGQQCMAVFVLPAGKNASTKTGAGGIAKGAEILVSYGKGFWSKRKEEQEASASQDV